MTDLQNLEKMCKLVLQGKNESWSATWQSTNELAPRLATPRPHPTIVATYVASGDRHVSRLIVATSLTLGVVSGRCGVAPGEGGGGGGSGAGQQGDAPEAVLGHHAQERHLPLRRPAHALGAWAAPDGTWTALTRIGASAGINCRSQRACAITSDRCRCTCCRFRDRRRIQSYPSDRCRFVKCIALDSATVVALHHTLAADAASQCGHCSSCV